jgi:hypothetical protein
MNNIINTFTNILLFSILNTSFIFLHKNLKEIKKIILENKETQTELFLENKEIQTELITNNNLNNDSINDDNLSNDSINDDLYYDLIDDTNNSFIIYNINT